LFQPLSAHPNQSSSSSVPVQSKEVFVDSKFTKSDLRHWFATVPEEVAKVDREQMASEHQLILMEMMEEDEEMRSRAKWRKTKLATAHQQKHCGKRKAEEIKEGV
jgi:hypothetical protein